MTTLFNHCSTLHTHNISYAFCMINLHRALSQGWYYPQLWANQPCTILQEREDPILTLFNAQQLISLTNIFCTQDNSLWYMLTKTNCWWNLTSQSLPLDQIVTVFHEMMPRCCLHISHPNQNKDKILLVCFGRTPKRNDASLNNKNMKGPNFPWST